MKVFDDFVGWVADTQFFRRYAAGWPEPFNNVSFDAVLLLVILAVLIRAGLNGIRAYRFRIRVRLKERRMREQHIADSRRAKRDDETREMMNQYMRFIMLAQLRNMSSVSGMTFEEWMAMKGMAERGEIVPEGVQMTEEDTGSEPVDPCSGSMAADDCDAEIQEGEAGFQDNDENTERVEFIGCGYPDNNSDFEDETDDGNLATLTLPELIEEVPSEDGTGQQAVRNEDINYKELLQEKRAEDDEAADQEMVNDFFAVLNDMKKNAGELEQMEEMSRMEMEIRQQNLETLDCRVREGLVIEDDGLEAVNNSGADKRDDPEFEKRRIKALRAEEKEAAKCERAKVKELKREQKRAKKRGSDS